MYICKKRSPIQVPSGILLYRYFSNTLLYCFSDVYIDVPDTIDISHMRSKGLQPGEELLPEAGQFRLKILYNNDKFCPFIFSNFS